MQIQQATATDIPVLHRLVNSAYRGESSKKGWTTEADLLDGQRTTPEALQELLDPPHSVILKYLSSEGLIEGCVNLQQKEGKLYLGMLSVNPEHQGAGIGKHLLEAAEKQARAQGLDTIQMTVISVRTELIQWYERRGYRDTGARIPFPAPDPSFGIARIPLEFIVMEKKLPD